jgi:L-fucose isomerase-like protein
MSARRKMTMAVIVGNRGFFPDHLAKTGREEILRSLTAAGTDAVTLTPEESKYGAVETREESHRCADLFKRNRERIEHHVAANLSTIASAVYEATTRYLNWDMHYHGGTSGAC